MLTFIVLLIFGGFVIGMGVVNMRGNLSTLHSYHVKRVTEENRMAFGRLVGGGTALIGASIVLYGVCFLIYEKTGSDLPILIGTPLLIVGIVVGMVLSVYAMIKYNKGIF